MQIWEKISHKFFRKVTTETLRTSSTQKKSLQVGCQKTEGAKGSASTLEAPPHTPQPQYDNHATLQLWSRRHLPLQENRRRPHQW